MITPSTFEPLNIPSTIVAGPGPGATDPRVLEAFSSAGLADHMHPQVLKGLIESKHMLRQIWGTSNVYTFGVAGTGWSGLDCLFSAVMPGDSVLAFTNGTFSGIDALTLRIKAATRTELKANPLDPDSTSVTTVEIPHGESISDPVIDNALATHRPKWAFMAHWETGSGRKNDIQAFSDACECYGVMGLVDAVSSLGVEDFSIDDYPGIAGWASCPQKGISCLPLTYAPVSFTDRYIKTLRDHGAYTYCHNPIFEARHWGIVDGADVESGSYHRTHSAHAVAAFHESLRIALDEGIQSRAEQYVFHESVLREVIVSMGCVVTSNMPSLIVLNLPPGFNGREMELVQHARANGFCIWPTLSEPVQIRIGILNQTAEDAIRTIANRFAAELDAIGVNVDRFAVNAILDSHYPQSQYSTGI